MKIQLGLKKVSWRFSVGSSDNNLGNGVKEETPKGWNEGMFQKIIDTPHTDTYYYVHKSLLPEQYFWTNIYT